ncbi:hypothetical protein AB0H43_36100 [Hamadaea sp. NPDC050747]|uniref:hypothetical protein n=1 Tax=Hamadaea sp. NPDC050747 TaxID=3155789 RepID=UPI0033DBF135
MRRALALTALGAALLTAAACGSSTDTTTSGSPSTAATSAKPDYTANTKTVCTELKTKLSTMPSDTTLQTAVTEAIKGKKTQAEITAATVVAVKKVLVDWVAQVKDTAATAEDPELKAALLATEADMETAINGLTSLDDIEKSLAAIDQKDGSKKATTLCKAAGVDLDS